MSLVAMVPLAAAALVALAVLANVFTWTTSGQMARSRSYRRALRERPHLRCGPHAHRWDVSDATGKQPGEDYQHRCTVCGWTLTATAPAWICADRCAGMNLPMACDCNTDRMCPVADGP